MTYDRMPAGWLPTVESVTSYRNSQQLTNVDIPERHVGTNDSPLLAEIYVKAFDKGILNEDVKDSTTPLYLLTKFYTGRPQYAIPSSISSYFLGLGLVGEAELIAYLYFYSWNPERVTALISVIKTVVSSQREILSIRQTDLDNFVEIQVWLQNEGITVPSKLSWALRQSPYDRRVELFMKTNGDTEEMLRVLSIGGTWEILEDHFLGDGELPLSFLEDLYGGVN